MKNLILLITVISLTGCSIFNQGYINKYGNPKHQHFNNTAQQEFVKRALYWDSAVYAQYGHININNNYAVK